MNSWTRFSPFYTRIPGFLAKIRCVRFVFSEHNYRIALQVASHVPIGLKFMIYLFFIGRMNWLRDEPIEIRFGCLFPKSRDKTEGDSDQADDTGMAGILFQMAESGVFGNMEQTSKVSMWNVFLRLYQIHNQIKNTKR